VDITDSFTGLDLAVGVGGHVLDGIAGVDGGYGGGNPGPIKFRLSGMFRMGNIGEPVRSSVVVHRAFGPVDGRLHGRQVGIPHDDRAELVPAMAE
jgi:hypothetical protein